MNKSEKRAQTFLYMGVLLTLIAADWHWYPGEFPEESFVAGLPVMKVVYVLWIAAHCHLPGSQRRVLLEASEAGSSLYPQE